ncbi:MAG TPA: VWA domain-containing protein [Candidatus Synoicihabitans sp.]|nr:VWA domain-containing protein [Candidatus Synoicihabitans sp.]
MLTVDWTFHSPWWFLALLLIPGAMALRRRRRLPVLLVPFAASWYRPSFAPVSRWPIGLAVAGLVLVVIALARPQRVEDRREVRSQGYDIILAIDLSGSMLAEDFERGGERINRLQVIKPVIQAFINERPSDRIGIVVFSGRAYTLAPLTFDHRWLEQQVGRLKIGLIEDGTALGDGLGVSLSRLEQASREAGSRRQGAFVVLLTDGANNRGGLTPAQGAEIAKSRGIPIYTIGAGKDGLVPFPVIDPESGRTLGYRRVMSDLDENALREIAATTGGRFFRADDRRTIEGAFAAIDEAQKIEFQAKSYLLASELFPWFAVPGAAALLLAGLLTQRRRSAAASGESAPVGRLAGAGASPGGTR